jgi:hypothetical protein
LMQALSTTSAQPTMDEAVSMVSQNLDCEKSRQRERAKASIDGLVSKGIFNLADGRLHLKMAS